MLERAHQAWHVVIGPDEAAASQPGRAGIHHGTRLAQEGWSVFGADATRRQDQRRRGFYDFGETLGGTGVVGFDEIDAQLGADANGITHLFHGIVLISGDQLAAGINMGDGGQAELPRLANEITQQG